MSHPHHQTSKAMVAACALRQGTALAVCLARDKSSWYFRSDH
ncbi:hypothetical protein MPNT_90038 [Candidatus Methylacidithermus pantelleriae]|uniref:Uncharacterized protein n=1 Tax=Candidatus Methylacidithermus pantelleriae TaxID=2744239 RepID=A0A8J2BR72_9BACT|nr:hypothetical protein MPNT_90038 [Candidatus Methylacidithermus pantelleriae]